MRNSNDNRKDGDRPESGNVEEDIQSDSLSEEPDEALPDDTQNGLINGEGLYNGRGMLYKPKVKKVGEPM